ncbi:rRNA maturation RNase YbeY [Candidatus Peregrinibacteria bacterium CG11_big_fil_rev_8_21_14_0_20_46_8]|nr:MAG: rRNA maturation RNase YbeY [Candidatus Peregrinibacteria bacterium CG11_big_fil_rev_8_21_14_0_20_46_8]
MQNLVVTIYNRTRTKVPLKPFEELLAPATKILLREKKLRKDEQLKFELSLIGDTAMQTLNKTVHYKDRPTDVVSLSYYEEHSGDNFVGEIFIALPYARRQAKKIGQSLKEELRFLFVHGLLHIFGYDHMEPKQEQVMLALTYEILER